MQNSDQVIVTRSRVPGYLVQSQLFANTFGNNTDAADDAFPVPKQYFKPTSRVASIADLEWILATLDYWMSARLPDECVSFCLQYENNSLPEEEDYAMRQLSMHILLTVRREGAFRNAPQLEILRDVLDTQSSHRATVAAGAGALNILQVLVADAPEADRKRWRTANEVCEAAAKNGHADCLAFAHSVGYPITDMTCCLAAEHGHLDCLELLHELLRKQNHMERVAWHREVCQRAAQNGFLNCLRYLHENGARWGYTSEMAAKHGQLDCLVYAHEHGCPWSPYTCEDAAECGQLQCLVYAHEHGAQWSRDTCQCAAKGGHTECMIYAHEHGAVWHDTCAVAAIYGHLSCLQHAHERGASLQGVCFTAANNGNLACLAYALSHDPDECGPEVCETAAMNGHLECLRYLHKHGVKWTSCTCRAATQYPTIACLRYAHVNGCDIERTRVCRAIRAIVNRVP